MKWLNKIVDTYKKGLDYDKVVLLFTKEQEQFKDAISDLEKENILLHSEIKDLEQALPEKLDTFSLERSLAKVEEVIEHKPYKYTFKGDGKDYDIKFSLTYTYTNLVKVYTEDIRKKYKPSTPLECVEAVQKWFIYDKKPTYIRDKVLYGKEEYWEKADNFLVHWRGDCDDVSIAMHVLIKSLLDLLNLSEHYDRLYLHVNDNYLEMHANNIWLHDDGYFYTIESTIDLQGTFKQKWLKVPLANDSFYTKVVAIANLNGSHKGSNAIKQCFL